MKNKALKILLAGIVLLLIADGYLIFGKTPTSPPKVSRLHGAIVRLVSKDYTFCTGTVITPNTVLTAAHCVITDSPFGSRAILKEIEIRPTSNAKLNVTGRVTAIRYQMDQAIITGDFHKFNNLKFIPDIKKLDSSLLKNSSMTACGFPLGGNLFCTAIFYKDMSNFMWRMHGTLIPGMSGGPVLTDNDSTVVATNVAVEGADSIVSPIYNLDMSIEQGEEK